MPKKLIIVESPTKAHTIKKIMGSEYEVLASKGHIRDLPERTLGVNIEKNFAPKYELSKDKKAIISELKKGAEKAEAIYLAPDPDREGEAIAWHLREILLKSAGKDTPFYRVRYNEITKNAVQSAFADPGEIDMHQVDAQQARRVLDRIVGYKVSPVLWRRLRKGLSAGRVQSVALRLVAEREQKIKAFKAVEYWLIGVDVASATSAPFYARLARVDGKAPVIPKDGDDTPPTFHDEASVRNLLDELQGAQLKVSGIKDREISRHALPPFMTSTLQQAASSVLGFEPRKTMDLAQSLFEGKNKISTGLITYMRTDSVAISNEARAQAEKFIKSNYGEEYFSQNHYRSRSNAQAAHEAIRPTDVNLTPESLKGKITPQELRLYELIWRRFVASLMASAKIQRRTVEIEPVKEGLTRACIFSASTSKVSFDGFMKLLKLDPRKKPEDEESEDNEPEYAELPELNEGDALRAIEWKSECKHSNPPSRFSEASLIKALEANGVGRPSTYATILGTLNARKYTKREKGQLAPTELGLDVNALLVAKMPALFDVAFTAQMESELDEIEAGKIEWHKMMSNFWERFSTWLENSKEPPADSAKVSKIMELLAAVKTWHPSMKKGKRLIGDEPFVDSVREQIEKGEKPISEKQLTALAQTAIRYKDQIPNAESALCELGFGSELEKDAASPGLEHAKQRLELLKAVDLNERQEKFIKSLRDQTERGKKLSPRQLQILESIIVENQASIPDFEAIKGELKLGENQATQDTVSPVVMKMLAQVTKWSEPIKRGKRIFDDREFHDSVAKQFAVRGTLSPKQLWSMKKLCVKYRDQIADFDALADELGLSRKK